MQLHALLHNSAPPGKKLFALGVQKRGELVRYESRSGGFVPYLGGISAIGLAFSGESDSGAYITYPEGNLWQRVTRSCRSSYWGITLWGRP